MDKSIEEHLEQEIKLKRKKLLKTAIIALSWNRPLDGYKIIQEKWNGYVVYSVGVDIKDNGGTPNRKVGKGSDITYFRLLEKAE